MDIRETENYKDLGKEKQKNEIAQRDRYYFKSRGNRKLQGPRHGEEDKCDRSDKYILY